MKRNLIICLVTILMFGCASSSKKIQASWNPWIGHNIDTLIMKWGTPSNVYNRAGSGYIVYTWLYQGGTLITANYFPSINTGYASAYTPYCRVDWTTTQDGTIIRYRWEGSCRVTK